MTGLVAPWQMKWSGGIVVVTQSDPFQGCGISKLQRFIVLYVFFKNSFFIDNV